MKNLILLALSIVSCLACTESRAGEFKFDTEITIGQIDRVVAVLNKKAPAYENEMETITAASRDGRILVEEIELTREADNCIQAFSKDKLKQLLYDATANRYCNTNLKFLMDGNVSLRLVFFLHGKEFYRVLQTPFSCTIVN